VDGLEKETEWPKVGFAQPSPGKTQKIELKAPSPSSIQKNVHIYDITKYI
jgi:hypothetical protein